MADITQILRDIEQGEPGAAEQLLPLAHDELRKLAGQRLAREHPGQTLQATALLHEASLRLVGTEKAASWSSPGHFFAACAEAVRRTLIDNARRSGSQRRGAGQRPLELRDDDRPEPLFHLMFDVLERKRV
jgi:RNA polymerase sigma factor (TIGR02999 family)